MEERGLTQQLVLNLARFTADLQQQVTTLKDQYDEENEENAAALASSPSSWRPLSGSCAGRAPAGTDRGSPGPAAQTQ